MMTGRKPESLIDKSTMTWKWHQWVPTLTPWFAKILNKMLSRMPNSRYQSANEVAQALRSVSDFVGPSATSGHPTDNFTPPTGTPSRSTASGYESPSTTNNSSSVPLSRGKRTTTNIKSSSYTPQNSQQPQQNPLRGILNTPWGVALGSATAAIVFIIIPLFLVGRSLTTSSSGSKTPPPVATPATTTTELVTAPPPIQAPAPTAAVEPSPSVSVVPPAPAVVAAEALSVEVGKPLVKEGALNPTQPTVFSLNLPVGQRLKATLASAPAGATMNILAPNQANVDVYAKNTVSWEGNLPLAGEYRIEIVPLAGAASNYKLEVTTTVAPPPGVSASPTPVSK
jgi:hypothetical protein